VQQAKNFKELSANDARAISAKKKVEYLRKINCFALFLLSPFKKPLKSLEFHRVLNRYSWTSRCFHTACNHTLDDTNYEKHTYVTVVNFQNTNGGYSFTFVKSRRLPIFYHTTVNSSIQIRVELISPCRFQATMDLLPVKNTKEAYDKVFLFGQKTNCSAIAWNYYDSTTPATTPCVPIGDPPLLYEEQSSTILSIVSKSFFNSTAFYWDWNRNGGRTTDPRLIKICSKANKEARNRNSGIFVTRGFAVAEKKYYVYPAYHIMYEESYNFITCDGTEEYLSFLVYASPFSWNI
jgi:hypothetical protein